jgi:hypothetical protein
MTQPSSQLPELIIPASTEVGPLEEVVNEVRQCPAPAAIEVLKILIPQKIEFLSSSPSVASRSRFNVLFPAFHVRLTEVPSIKHFKDPSYLHPHGLKLLLQKEDFETDHTIFFPRLPAGADARQTSREFIDHLEDMHYLGNGSAWHFKSSGIESHLKLDPPYERDESVLTQPEYGDMSILPCGALLPLETPGLMDCHKIYLLSGVRVYIIWPPERENMKPLNDYLIKKQPTRTHLEVCKQFGNGVALIQRPGQVVCIPAFYPTIIIVTKTSTAITYSRRRVKDIPWRLAFLGLTCAQQVAAFHPDTRRILAGKSFDIVNFAADMEDFFRSARGAVDNQVSTIQALGKVWKHFGSGEPSFLSYVLKTTTKAHEQSIVLNVPMLWDIAVKHHGLENCPVCDRSIQDCTEGFIDHFQQEHWTDHWSDWEVLSDEEEQDNTSLNR